MVVLGLHLVGHGELLGGGADILHAVGVEQVQQQVRVAVGDRPPLHPNLKT